MDSASRPHKASIRPAAPPAAKPRVGRTRLLVNGLHSKSGGGVTYLRNVLPLFARDEEIDLHLCIQEDQRSLLPAGMENVTLHVLPHPLTFWRLLFWEQISLPRLARRIAADATFSPANYGPVFSPNTVILIRNAIHVAFVERRPIKFVYWAGVYAATALSLIRCRRAIAVSEYARRSVTAGLLKGLRDRIRVIPHGVDPMYTPPPANAKREDFILAVSDVYVQKNLTNLLFAVARLRPYHPSISLRIAGSFIDADYYETLKRIVDNENLADHVQFLGQVSPANLVDLYRRCAVFIFPSVVETFGNPLVEAMASAAPIASSNTAAMPEVVGDAGLLFDPTDVDAIAVAINKFIRNPAIRVEYSRRAVARAQSFSWEATASRTLAVIKEAASTPR